MGNEPPTLGSDYVRMDVDCLIVEPQNGNVSMDSVMRLSEKITDNALGSGEVPRMYGQSGAANARDKEDIHNERVLDAMPSGDGFQINDNFCSMGDDYLLGVEFGESITNIDYGSVEGLQVSVSNSQIQDINYRSSQGFHASVSDSRAQGSDAVFINPWKSELNEVTPFSNGKFNTGSSGSNDDSNLRDCNYPYEEKAHASCDLIQVPDTTCTSHLTSEVKEVPNGENGLVHSRSFMLSDTPGLRVCKLTSESTKHASASCVSQNMNYRSGHSSPNSLSDENDGRVSPTEEVAYSQHVKKNDEEMTGKVDQEKRLRRRRSSTASSAQGNCNVHPMEKRLRKPTQRYIDELSYPITSKKRRELSSSKEESIGTKVRRKCDTGSKATKSDEEEFSVKAIQVPFGAIVNQECPASPVHVVLHGSDRTWTNRSRDDLYAPDNNQKRKNGNGGSNHLKNSDDRAIALFLKNTEDYAPESPIKKRSARLTMSNEKRKYGWATPASPKRKDTHLATANKKKKTDWVTALGQRKAKDNSLTVANHRTPKDVVDAHLAVASLPKKHDMVSNASPDNKKVDNCVVSKAHQKKVEDDDDDDLAEESPEQVSGRRKNHRLWSITEVGKLLDGVSQYGVGRWSRIKKLLFASSPHRTSVDLKDKWRNLLKASGLHDQSKNGGKKRNVPWRPLPKSVLRHVRELASMHPYPKGDGRRVKIARKNNKKNDDDDCDDEDDDDETTDITLSDYKRILQSTTNGGG